MLYYVYIIKSLKDNKYYIGQTSNLDKRLLVHNNGCVSSTKNRRPFIVVYKEEFNSKTEAIKKENAIKKYKNTEKFLAYR